jgi:HEAT repeat protein
MSSFLGLALFLMFSNLLPSLVTAQTARDEEIQSYIEQLENSNDYRARAIAAKELGKMGLGAERAVPDLVTALRNDGEDIAVRFAALGALGEIGSASKDVKPELFKEIDTVLFDVSLKTGGGGDIFESVAYVLFQKMRGHTIEEDLKGAIVLVGEPVGGLKVSKEEINEQIKILKYHPNPKSRSDAAQALGKIVTDSKRIVPVLIEALEKDSDGWVRSNAAQALGRIGTDPEQVVPVLIEAMEKDSDGQVRSNAAQALGRIGTDPERVVPVLIEALEKDSDGQVRSNAAQALGRIGIDPEQVVPALIEALEKDSDAEVRSGVAQVLGNRSGTDPERIVPVLTKALKDDEEVGGSG